MSIIIIDPSQSKVTVMPNTHERGPTAEADIEAALERYRSRYNTSHFDWMEFDGPLNLNFL
jgi:hypothetical protein